ncbi:MAG: sugar transferase [Patescibacteria group bacterium]|nr:sugar transferase [Patescibacteria group bacterium]
MTDILGAFVGITFLLVIYPFAAIAIKLDSPGPVMVGLDRVSKGKRVRVYKFRSMKTGTHDMKYGELAVRNERKDGPFFKIKNDPRITRVGRILRKFRLDEFPQFINVLRGDLSLVGPRPHEPNEIEQYPAAFRSLPLAKAGITGYSQVNGASSLPFLNELELDDYYLAHQSFLFDLRIILKTVAILIADPTAV